MSYLRQFETLIEIVQITGLLYGKAARVFDILGRRRGFTSTTDANDIKEFDNGVALIPEFVNVTLDVISSSADDTNAAGIGVRKVRVVYLNASNVLVESPDINLNGTTLVTSVLTGVNSIVWMEATEVGSNFSAVGDIRLRLNGGTVEVEQISANFNKSRTSHFQVPAGHTGFVPNWKTQAINADQNTNLVMTVHSFDRTLSTVYTSQANSSIAGDTNSGNIALPFIKVPALSQIKITTVSASAAASAQVDTTFVVIIVAD